LAKLTCKDTELELPDAEDDKTDPFEVTYCCKFPLS